VSQPPAGGYPPPEPSQPGGYPPPANPGQPAGGYPPPAPGYQPPPGYTPPPAPGQGGFQQPPAPGYPPQAPAPGAYPPPVAGGYPPPAGGYPPAAQGYGPPAAYGAPGAPTGRPGNAAFDLSKISTIGWGVIGAALLTLIASFTNFWSVSYGAISYGGYSGWSLWWWIPVVLAIAVGVVYALTLFGVMKPGQVKPEWLFYGAAASFVLMIIVLIHTFAYDGPYSVLGGTDTGISSGPGFGVWLALIATLALTYFSALAAQKSGAKLPFKVPGPTA